MSVLYIVISVIGLVLLAMLLLRLFDKHAEHSEWQGLSRLQVAQPDTYHPSCVAGLPEPAQRYFNFVINPGTPLYTVAEISMCGEFSLGSKLKPDYRAMSARQLLAAPQGFLWQMRVPSWPFISGSDSHCWTRFRILGLLPVARRGGDTDHARSAFGRMIAEAVFWTPAALLPGPGVSWQPLAENAASVTVCHAGLSQKVNVTVAADGRPVEVAFSRWSNENPARAYQLQPFGGRLSDFRDVEGFCLPFAVEAGNGFGTDDYFPFFRARVNAIRFPVMVR